MFMLMENFPGKTEILFFSLAQLEKPNHQILLSWLENILPEKSLFQFLEDQLCWLRENMWFVCTLRCVSAERNKSLTIHSWPITFLVDVLESKHSRLVHMPLSLPRNGQKLSFLLNSKTTGQNTLWIFSPNEIWKFVRLHKFLQCTRDETHRFTLRVARPKTRKHTKKQQTKYRMRTWVWYVITLLLGLLR